MNVFRRGMIFVTFFGCCFGMALMAASLGTEFWFQAEAIQMDVRSNLTRLRPEAKGSINFGLFRGVKVLNWGIGDRETVFYINMDTAADLMSSALWLATVILLCVALLLALTGAIFGVINAVISPIEVITGIAGLYLWNGLAAVCGLGCVICWGVQYSLHLKSNVLIEDAKEGWTTEGFQSLGYSYWLVVVSVGVHLANMIIIAVGTYERKEKTQYEAPESKPGNIMLY